MRIQFLLPAAGVAALCCSCVARTASAQAAPVPVPDTTTVPAAPAPSSTVSPSPAAPAYGQTTPQTTTHAAVQAEPAYIPYGIPDEDRKKTHYGSTYIPVDSWVYPAVVRLYSLGYADTIFLNMRPYTRQSLARALYETRDDVLNSESDEAKEILAKVERYLRDEPMDGVTERGTVYGLETVYGRAMGISGQTLRDSYHLGQTIANDYGRPYEPGFNAVAGWSSVVESGRFSFYVRGEYQHAPSADGYSSFLSSELSQGTNVTNMTGDFIPYSGYNLHQATIPSGPIATANPFRLQEASLSFHVLGHEISGGKTDAWLGPTQGGALAWSNNAENIYSFRVNRVDPLHIPGFSRIFGPLRYDVFYGSLKGHTSPNSPYVHSAMAALQPTANLEFGFQRTVIFGGKGHEPVTLHTFLRSFFSISDTNGAEKNSARDPGARYSDFSFSYRLPLLRKYATLVADSIAHDDVSPISAPRRAAYRTGIYLSQIPGMRRLDFRVEAVSTDPGVRRSTNGEFNYFEIVQLQGYTNKGFIMGDWIGREAKGGQAWITYHLSGDEWVQVEYLNKKNEKDFIPGAFDPVTNTYGPGGTTQNQFKVDVVKRFAHDNVELNAWYQHEGWKAGIYLPGLQANNVFSAQLTFFPELKKTAFVPWKRKP